MMILANNDVGLYKFRAELLERLCREYRVVIVLPNGEFVPAMQEMGCEYVPFAFQRRGKNPFADLWQIKRYVSLLRQYRPDAVLTYTIKPNIYGGLACRITHTPVIANVTGLGTAVENGGLLSVVTKNLYRIGLRGAACVFFQNRANQERFTRERIVEGRSRLIPGSGVNLKKNALEEYPADTEGLRFLFVGRLMKDKGVEELLSAVRTLHAEDRRVTLDIVGACEEDYLQILPELQEEGAIRYHGMQQEVHAFYTNAHAVVLPSYHEGMANVLLEAAATGRPVIATRVPGCEETFDEGVTGFGCEARSTESLLNAMRRFACLDAGERREMGLRGRRKMEESFDRTIVADAYMEEIDRILSLA